MIFSQNNLEKFRWLLLLVFVAGYAITYERFSYVAGEYLIYSILAISTCAILLSQIKSYEIRYSALWLTLGIFILVYFVRFYWIVVDPLPVKIMLHTPVYKKMIQDNVLFEGFRISVLSFATLGLSTSLLLFFLRDRKASMNQAEHAVTGFYWFSAKSLALLLPLIMIALAIVSHKYHIGEMGADSGDPLPYRLKGVIFYARFIMIPLLIIWLIYLSGRSGHIFVARLGVVFLMLHGVIDMLLRGSRSSLLLSVLLLVFLVMSGGLKLYRKEKVVAFFVLIAGLFMVPIMTEYRMHRVVEHLPVMDAILTSLSVTGSEWWATLLRGIEFVLFRMPGIEAVSAIVSLDTKPLGMGVIEVFQDKQGVAGYLTHEVYEITREANTLSAPSFVGWFYLVGGMVGVIVGSFLTSVIVISLWSWLGSKYFICSPVARTFFLWILFTGLTEGTLDSMLYMLVVGVFVITTIEMVMRVGTSIMPHPTRT